MEECAVVELPMVELARSRPPEQTEGVLQDGCAVRRERSSWFR